MHMRLHKKQTSGVSPQTSAQSRFNLDALGRLPDSPDLQLFSARRESSEGASRIARGCPILVPRLLRDRVGTLTCFRVRGLRSEVRSLKSAARTPTAA